MEQTTTTDRAWANGDLVRLTCEDPNGPGRHRGQPGEWGMVHSVGEDGSVKVRLAGFSRIPGSVGPIATVPGDTLVAWERRPEDEPSIRSNVVATLQSLAWIGRPLKGVPPPAVAA